MILIFLVHSQSPTLAAGLKSPQATQLRQCQERLANLEAEIIQLTTEKDNLQNQVESAKEEIETRFCGQLMELLEEEMNCAICNEILIEVRVPARWFYLKTLCKYLHTVFILTAYSRRVWSRLLFPLHHSLD